MSIYGIAQFAPNKGNGEIVTVNGQRQHINVGQKFTGNKYFWPRPSAVDYNAAGSGGSNKGITNPDYLAEVKGRIDTFLLKNPGIKKSELPADSGDCIRQRHRPGHFCSGGDGSGETNRVCP